MNVPCLLLTCDTNKKNSDIKSLQAGKLTFSSQSNHLWIWDCKIRKFGTVWNITGFKITSLVCSLQVKSGGLQTWWKPLSSFRLSPADTADRTVSVPVWCVSCCLSSELCWFWCWFFTLCWWSTCSGGDELSVCFTTSRNGGTGNSAGWRRQWVGMRRICTLLNLTLSRYIWFCWNVLERDTGFVFYDCHLVAPWVWIGSGKPTRNYKWQLVNELQWRLRHNGHLSPLVVVNF